MEVRYTHGTRDIGLVLAVHSYGITDSLGCNSAIRFDSDIILRFYQRMNALRVVTIRSYIFPDVYIRCDGSGVVKRKQFQGSGVVNCQYQPP